MRQIHLSLLSMVVGFALYSGSLWAHHSPLAEFDPSLPVKVTGTIQRVDWQNPHVWFFVDVMEEDGTITTWGFSTWPPGSLMRGGITKETFKIGTVVNVEGMRARDGSHNSSTRSLTLEDGTALIGSREEYLRGQ